LWYFGLLGDQTKTNCGLDFSLDFSQFRLLCNTLMYMKFPYTVHVIFRAKDTEFP
jgi:hypothetical protein